MSLNSLRQSVRSATHADEHELVSELVSHNALSESARQRIVLQARQLVSACRQDKQAKGTLDAFLQEFALSNKEGVALMCLAESLLRIPDAITASRLIAEKIHSGDWSSHQRQSNSLFMNASIWGLMLTGRVIELDPRITEKTQTWTKRLTNRLGAPVVRKAVYQAMKIISGHYVLGTTIEEGILRGGRENPVGTRFSFDMLGESARTKVQAERYFDSYRDAIEKVGQAETEGDVYSANGVSVKLSALHPRYQYAHAATVMSELLPRIKTLCLEAKSLNMGLSIDAEEADRLDLSLDIFEALARDPELKGWQGLGFVLQAYQKRAPMVAEWLIDLAHTTKRRLMVRLVKGAYWDTEIKRAQEQGLEDYPVFTRKPNTDFCYQHCAAILLREQKAIYPQFATHNAHTVALIVEMANGKAFEFQRLHGMGCALHQQMQVQMGDHAIPLRVYAPIGNHEDLLPYLVRRLLENGANSSFVNRFLDANLPVEELIRDNYAEVTGSSPYRHKRIPLPLDIYLAAGNDRKNAKGIDLDCPVASHALLQQMAKVNTSHLRAAPIVNGLQVSESTPEVIEQAIASAATAQADWEAGGIKHRASILRKAADLMEAKTPELMGIITAEAGRTIADSLSEVREAVDFCRYYALQAENLLSKDTNLGACGVFFCISPWNFPLAIFTGQVAAALVAGNAVLAKPAEETPLIAVRAVELLHEAGVPAHALHLLPGDGASIGGQVISDLRLSGVAFTGSTETAQLINRQLADRSGAPVPFVAETGGQNCMIVDSTALPEQLVDDVIGSAFQSAGQRCSALRVLFLQEDIAEAVLTLLKDALASVILDHPAKLSADIGPVISAQALTGLEHHIKRMRKEGRLVATGKLPAHEDSLNGWYCAPHIFEIDSLVQLEREVFGPILHVVRYATEDLDDILQQINQSGYELTLGVHSRIENFARHIFSNTKAGNTYVNRNMIGATVGVNSFGGRGLSGTGPKAGGVHYIYRFMKDKKALIGSLIQPLIPMEKPVSPQSLPSEMNGILQAAERAHQQWSKLSFSQRIQILTAGSNPQTSCNPLLSSVLPELTRIARPYLAEALVLPGPTGEYNALTLHPAGVFVLLGQGDPASASAALGLALISGCSLLVCGFDRPDEIRQGLTDMVEEGLPADIVQTLPADQLPAVMESANIAGVTGNMSQHDLDIIKVILAKRPGAIVPIFETPPADSFRDLALWGACMTRFNFERTYTDNLVAKGGNAQLFNLKE